MPRRTNLEIRTSDLENSQIILRDSVVQELKMLRIENNQLRQEMAELKQGVMKRIDQLDKKNKKKLSFECKLCTKKFNGETGLKHHSLLKHY